MLKDCAPPPFTHSFPRSLALHPSRSLSLHPPHTHTYFPLSSASPLHPSYAPFPLPPARAPISFVRERKAALNLWLQGTICMVQAKIIRDPDLASQCNQLAASFLSDETMEGGLEGLSGKGGGVSGGGMGMGMRRSASALDVPSYAVRREATNTFIEVGGGGHDEAWENSAGGGQAGVVEGGRQSAMSHDTVGTLRDPDVMRSAAFENGETGKIRPKSMPLKLDSSGRHIVQQGGNGGNSGDGPPKWVHRPLWNDIRSIFEQRFVVPSTPAMGGAVGGGADKAHAFTPVRPHAKVSGVGGGDGGGGGIGGDSDGAAGGGATGRRALGRPPRPPLPPLVKVQLACLKSLLRVADDARGGSRGGKGGGVSAVGGGSGVRDAVECSSECSSEVGDGGMDTRTV